MPCRSSSHEQKLQADTVVYERKKVRREFHVAHAKRHARVVRVSIERGGSRCFQVRSGVALREVFIRADIPEDRANVASCLLRAVVVVVVESRFVVPEFIVA